MAYTIKVEYEVGEVVYLLLNGKVETATIKIMEVKARKKGVYTLPMYFCEYGSPGAWVAEDQMHRDKKEAVKLLLESLGMEAGLMDLNK